jgi:hypothetical protein
VPFQVTRNLTKLTRVSAAFSTGPAVGACGGGLANRALALTGTLNLATQTGTTGQGTIVLTGTVDGATVTFRGTFGATVNPDDTITASLALTASGAFIGTSTATGTGSITDGVLNASFTGGTFTVTSPPLGTCPFTGSLAARGEPTIFFSLLAAPPYPLAITEGSVGAAVVFDPAPPLDPPSVRFTGPAGSGVTNVPASLRLPNAAGSFYETDTAPIAGRNVVGTWTVSYGGRLIRSFTVGNPEAEARFIAMVPTLTVVPAAGGPRVSAVSWVFKDRLTGATVPAPLHADSIQIELGGSFAGIGPNPEFGYYASPDFPRTTTSHTLPAAVPFGQIDEIYISFKDTLTGNFYVTSFRRP